MSEGPAYRPDIDGLRGISVAAVVVFHLWPRALPGGFTGVDVFFVISGFLITTNLRASLAGGRLRISDFYARRIRRLFPSLLLVLAVTLVLGAGVLLEAEWRSLGKHALAGLLYLSNLLVLTEGGYFDVPAATKPLHHLWSLAVEEQFYLIWPWLLALGHRLGRRGVAASLTALLVLSFGANLVLTLDDPSSGFYLPFGRLWELGLGGLLSFGALEGRVAGVVGVAGLVLLGFSFLTISQVGFPGLIVLLPTLGAAGLIGSPGGVASRILATRPLVLLGLISYPLYLWHWPLLVYARITSAGFGPGPLEVTSLPLPEAGGVLGLSLLLSGLTLKWVEAPVRVRRRVSVGALLGLSALLATFAGATFAGAVPLPPSDPRRLVFEAAAHEPVLPPRVFQSLGKAPFTHYRLDDRPPVVAFVGDSNMLQYGGTMAARAKRGPYRSFVLVTTDGCPIFMTVDGPRCAGTVSELKSVLEAPEIDTVIIAAEWSLYFNSTRFTAEGEEISPGGSHARRSFAEFTLWLQALSRDKRVIVVTSTPTSPAVDPMRMVRRRWWHGVEIETGPLPRADLEAFVRPVDDQVRAAALEVGATIIDPFVSLCDAEVCPRTEQDEPLYRDQHHVRYRTLEARFREFDALLDPR